MTEKPALSTEPLTEMRSDSVELLVALLYDELHALARKLRGRGANVEDIRPTSLVSEAYLRIRDPAVSYRDRAAFVKHVCCAMRSIVVDRARKRLAEKRGGGTAPQPLGGGEPAREADLDGVLDLNEALDHLARLDAKLAQIAELRLIGGLELPEIAEVLATPLRTVERNWSVGRRWLGSRMSQEGSRD